MSIELYNTPQSKSQWLCIESQEIQQQLTPLLNEIDHQFNTVNPIEGWSLNDQKKSHITLYMGWNSKLNKNLQKELLERIRDSINDKPFTLKITPQNSTIGINDNFVILNFSDSKLYNLQKKVQKVAQKFIHEKGITKNDSWFDKDYNLHISLGSIDPEFRGSSKLKGKFRGEWRENLLNNYLTKPATKKITSIDLVCVNNSSLAKEEKKYYILGKVKLPKNNILNDKVSFPCQIKCLTKKLNKISQKGNIIDVQVDNSFNQYLNRPSINVTFDNIDDAEEILSRADGGRIYHNNDSYMIRLGENRLKNLFPNQGERLYRDIVARALYQD